MVAITGFLLPIGSYYSDHLSKIEKLFLFIEMYAFGMFFLSTKFLYAASHRGIGLLS